jgi:hypothetical protein
MNPRDMRAALRSLPVLTGDARLRYTRSETGWSKSLLWP